MSKLNQGRVLQVAGLVLLLGGGVAVGMSFGSESETDGPDAVDRRTPVGQIAAESTSAPAAQDIQESKLFNVPVSSSQPHLGSADALVTIVEWCDLPDPACLQIEPAVQALLERYPDDVRLVFRHYLDPARQESVRAHQFARIAHEQGGKFWEARELLMKHQGEVSLAVLEGFARKLGLDWADVTKGFGDGNYGSHVTADRIFGEMFEVTSTPTFFVNGRPLRTPDAKTLATIVGEERAHAERVVASGVPRAQLYAELTKKGTWVKPARFAHK